MREINFSFPNTTYQKFTKRLITIKKENPLLSLPLISIAISRITEVIQNANRLLHVYQTHAFLTSLVSLNVTLFSRLCFFSEIMTCPHVTHTQWRNPIHSPFHLHLSPSAITLIEPPPIPDNYFTPPFHSLNLTSNVSHSRKHGELEATNLIHYMYLILFSFPSSLLPICSLICQSTSQFSHPRTIIQFIQSLGI